MPKMMTQNQNEEQFQSKGVNSFTFSGVRVENLEETEYTLVSILVDTTGSVGGFENELLESLKTSVRSCQKSPRANNLLIRVCEFNSVIGVNEVHGFKSLQDINPNDYPGFVTSGLTPLFDATFNGVKAAVDYGENLISQDFDVNAIVFIITDGCDNCSSVSPSIIADQLRDCKRNEKLDSIVTVLIGINIADCKGELMEFKNNANIDEFVDVSEATDSKLAKLAQFISKSVSSTSQALGTGQSAPIQSLTI